LNDGEWLRRFLLIASLLSFTLILEEDTYLRLDFVQPMGSIADEYPAGGDS
jgi:hypothetical protein